MSVLISSALQGLEDDAVLKNAVRAKGRLEMSRRLISEALALHDGKKKTVIMEQRLRAQETTAAKYAAGIGMLRHDTAILSLMDLIADNVS